MLYCGIKKCAQCQTPILSFIDSKKTFARPPLVPRSLCIRGWQGCENSRIGSYWIRHGHECIDLTFSYFYLFLTATVPN